MEGQKRLYADAHVLPAMGLQNIASFFSLQSAGAESN